MGFSSNIVPPQKALADLAALFAPAYDAFEHGIEEARGYFVERQRAHDSHLFPHIVRYEALFRLGKTARVELVAGQDDHEDDVDAAADDVEAKLIRLRGLSNSGIQYRSSGYLMRAIKATPDGLVPPARSATGARFEYLLQEDQAVFEEMGESLRTPLRLVLLWHATPELALEKLSLACPRRSLVKAVECYWHVDIPRRSGAAEIDDLPIDRIPDAREGAGDGSDSA